MAKFIKLAGLFSSILILQILLTECATHERHEYIVTDFEMEYYEFSKGPETRIKNVILNDTIYENSYYGFKIDLVTDIINTVDISQLSLPLIQNAYATAKSTNDYVLMNEMEGISIITKYDFDSLHPANSNIEDLFIIYTGTVNDSLISLETGFIPFYEDFNEVQIPHSKEDIKIYLADSLMSSNKIQFEVFLHFVDHTSIMRETPMVWFN